MDHVLASKIVRDYVCSTCWSHLIETLDMTGSEVSCAVYGTEHQGYVTKVYVERRRSQSRCEAVEVDALLKQVGILPKKNEKQQMEELGF